MQSPQHTPVHYEAEIKRLTLNLHKEQAAHELTRKQLESTWDKFDLQHGINSGADETYQQLRKDKLRLEHELAEAKASLKDLVEELVATEGELDSRKQQVIYLQNQVLHNGDDHHSGDIVASIDKILGRESLEQEYNKLVVELASKESSLEQALKSYEMLKNEAAASKVVISEQQGLVVGLQAMIDEAYKLLSALQTEHTMVSARLAEVEQYALFLKEEKAGVDNNLSAAIAQNQSLTAEKDELAELYKRTCRTLQDSLAVTQENSRVKKLEEELLSAREESSALKSKLQNTAVENEQALAHLQANLQRLSDERMKLQQEFEHYQHSNRTEQLSELCNEQQDMLTAREARIRELLSLEHKLEDAESRTKTLTQLATDRLELLTVAETNTLQLQTELDNCHNQLEVFGLERTEADKKLESLSDQLMGLRYEHNISTDELVEARKQIAKLEAAYNQSKKDWQELVVERERSIDVHSTLGLLEAEKDGLQSQLSVTNTKLELAESQAHKLNLECEKLRTQALDYESQIYSAKQQSDGQALKLTALQQQLDTVLAQKNEVVAHMEQIVTEKNLALSSLATLQTSAEQQFNNKKIQELDATIDSLKEELGHTQSQNVRLSEELEVLRKKNMELGRQERDLLRDLEAKKRELERISSELDNLIVDHQEEVTEWTKQSDDLEKRAQEWRDKEREWSKKDKEAAQQAKQANALIKELEEFKGDSIRKIAELEEELRSLKETHERQTNEQRNSFKLQLNALEDELKGTKSLANDVTAQLTLSQDAEADLQKANGGLEAELSQARKKESQLLQDVQCTEKEKGALQSQLAKYQGHCNDAELRLDTALMEISEWKAKCQVQQRELESHSALLQEMRINETKTKDLGVQTKLATDLFKTRLQELEAEMDTRVHGLEADLESSRVVASRHEAEKQAALRNLQYHQEVETQLQQQNQQLKESLNKTEAQLVKEQQASKALRETVTLQVEQQKVVSLQVQNMAESLGLQIPNDQENGAVMKLQKLQQLYTAGRDKLEATLREQQDIIKETKQELERLQKLSFTQKEQLDLELKECKKALANSLAEAEQLTSINSDLQLQLEQALQQTTTRDKELFDLGSENQRIKTEIAASVGLVDDLRSRLQQAENNLRTSQETQESIKTEQSDKSLLHNSQLEALRESFESGIELLEHQVVQLHKDKLEFAALIAKERGECDRLREQLLQQEAELRHLREAEQQLISLHSTADQSFEALVVQVGVCVGERDAMAMKIQQLQEELQVTHEQADTLAKTVLQLNNLRETDSIKLNQLLSDYQQEQLALYEARQLLDAATESLLKAKTQCTDVEDKVVAERTSNEQLKADLAAAFQQHEQLYAIAAQLQSWQEECYQTVTRLQAELEAKVAENKQLWQFVEVHKDKSGEPAPLRLIDLNTPTTPDRTMVSAVEELTRQLLKAREDISHLQKSDTNWTADYVHKLKEEKTRLTDQLEGSLLDRSVLMDKIVYASEYASALEDNRLQNIIEENSNLYHDLQQAEALLLQLENAITQ